MCGQCTLSQDQVESRCEGGDWLDDLTLVNMLHFNRLLGNRKRTGHV